MPAVAISPSQKFTRLFASRAQKIMNSVTQLRRLVRGFCVVVYVGQVNEDGKIPVEHEQTNVPHIYAIGDCTSVDVLFHDAHWANPELTPVAVQVRGSDTKTLDRSRCRAAVFLHLLFRSFYVWGNRFRKLSASVQHRLATGIYRRCMPQSAAARCETVCYLSKRK